MRGSFDTLFTEANSGTAALVRSEHRITAEVSREPARSRRRSSRQVAAVDGVARRPRRSSKGYVQLVGADGDRIGGNGPPTRGSQLGDDPALNPWHVVDGRSARSAPARS